MRRLSLTLAVLTTAVTSFVQSAHAAPQSLPPVTGDKGDAKALLASGLKLFAAKDYLGALSVFQTAYARFPSGKILLNIGTTLRKLDRNAEAANAYQRYLDGKDGDPAKRAEVAKVLAELDAELGVIDLSITPTDAEVQIGNGAWAPAVELASYRVDHGDMVVRARKVGFVSAEEKLSIDAGQRKAVALTLAVEPPLPSPGGRGGGVVVDGGIETSVMPQTRSRVGAVALAHIDPANKGMAVLVGVTADTISHLQVQAAALLGPSNGFYGGAMFGFLHGRVQPMVAIGVPVFFSDGPRISLRGAAGVELELNRHFALIAEVGLEYAVNPEPSISKLLFIPAVGATARL